MQLTCDDHVSAFFLKAPQDLFTIIECHEHPLAVAIISAAIESKEARLEGVSRLLNAIAVAIVRGQWILNDEANGELTKQKRERERESSREVRPLSGVESASLARASHAIQYREVG